MRNSINLETIVLELDQDALALLTQIYSKSQPEIPIGVPLLDSCSYLIKEPCGGNLTIANKSHDLRYTMEKSVILEELTKLETNIEKIWMLISTK